MAKTTIDHSGNYITQEEDRIRKDAIEPELEYVERFIAQMKALSEKHVCDFTWRDKYMDAFNRFATVVRGIVRGDA